MSIQTEIVTQGRPSAMQPLPAQVPAPNTLSPAAVNHAVNQSAANAQHDPYAAASYGTYPAVVSGPYASAGYSAAVTAIPPYYAQQAQQQQQQQQQQQHSDPHDHPHLIQDQFPSSELRYTQQIEHPPPPPQQQQPHSRAQSISHATPPPIAGPSSTNSAGAKRKDKFARTAVASGDERAPPTKKRKGGRAIKDGENGDEDDVGPGGGAKHWSVDEKTRLFTWILEDDERWEQFGSKMNAIFREGSGKLFGSRKSFTALKSCYHRNLDVFKQIWLFEAFLIHPRSGSPRPQASSLPSPGTPSSSASVAHQTELLHAQSPSAFDTPQERQTYLDKKLDIARAADVPVGNLSVKVIDNWHERGWYVMFKRRFKEDPKTGVPIPSHDATPGQGWSFIPPPLPKEAQQDAQSLQAGQDMEHDMELDHGSMSQTQSPHPQHMTGPAASSASVSRRHVEPSDTLIPPSYSNASNKAVMSRASVSAASGTSTPHRTSLAESPVASSSTPSHATTVTNGHSLSYPPPTTPAAYTQSHSPASQYQPQQAQTQYTHSTQSSPQLPTAYSGASNGGYAHPHPHSAPFYPSPPAEYQAGPIAAPHQAQQSAASHSQMQVQLPQQQQQFQNQTLQALTHLTTLTQTLLGTCATLTELVRSQMEDSKVRTDLLRKREEREAVDGGIGGGGGKGEALPEALGRTQKASLAMDLLSNPAVGDEIKGVAADYLKKIFR